ncbi:MAG: ABC transporter permease subunit [Trueperaceae bacterium]|nr:ABC transporter permease subunit [Trueperaceae bacterium]
MTGALSMKRAAPSTIGTVPGVLLLAVAALGLFGPVARNAPDLSLLSAGSALLPVALLAALALLFVRRPAADAAAVVLALGSALLAVLAQHTQSGTAALGGWGYWFTLAGSLLAAAYVTGRLTLAQGSDEEGASTSGIQRILPAAVVPFLLLLTWEGLVVGNRVPTGIFPRVSDIGSALAASWRVLLADAYLTFVKEVLFGFSFGLASGFLAGTAIAFSSFLKRGFLPLATAFGAVPIVGLAPVLGRALGVNWESKAAVVIIVTFFPVVLNVVQGLTSVDPLRLELLRSYGARPLDVFFKLRLPNALPYLFNALKVAVVLAVVSVIVAEFLIPGPPNGLGQRISLSAHRGAFDIVFAAILVSSVISMLLYWGVTMLERVFTSWHPSARGR